MTEQVRVQETAKSKNMGAGELAEKFLREGKALDVALEFRRHEMRIDRSKSLLGHLGIRGPLAVRETVVYVPTVATVEVWPIYPQDILETEELYCRYLSPDGRVFEHDIDFGTREIFARAKDDNQVEQ